MGVNQDYGEFMSIIQGHNMVPAVLKSLNPNSDVLNTRLILVKV